MRQFLFTTARLFESSVISGTIIPMLKMPVFVPPSFLNFEEDISTKPIMICAVQYFIQYCFICRPSDSTVSEDAGIEPRTVATSALDVRRSHPHSARSHPHSARSHPHSVRSHQHSKLYLLSMLARTEARRMLCVSGWRCCCRGHRTQY
jgi:hypothetical protein